MPRRIEVELTSAREDGTWTWRAAGARQPKGVLDGAILHAGAKVGDVLRAEAEFDVEGITVMSVLPPKGARPEPERVEVIGPERTFTPVTSTLTGREERSNRRDRDRGDRGDRPDRAGGPGRRDRPSGDRPGGGGPGGGGPGGDRRPQSRDDRRPDGAGAGGDRSGRSSTGPGSAARSRPTPPPPRPKPKKLRPARTHRNALIESLPPEQQPVAEQLLRGGMPAVRTALDEQNTAARAAGTPEAPSATLLAMAESLVARARVADWLDRAEAALIDVDELALRDLRSVVVSADEVVREESTKELADRLREVLERRTAAEQADWLADVRSSLDDSRVVRALRLSSRPPEAGAPFPEDLTTRLIEAASAAMTGDIAPDRFATLVDAVAYSPVRRAVVPVGVPTEPSEELLAAVRKHAGRVPAIAAALGVEVPADQARAGRRRPPRSASSGQAAPVPDTAAAAGSAAPRPLPAGIRRIPPPPLPPGMAGRIPPPPPGYRPLGTPPAPPSESDSPSDGTELDMVEPGPSDDGPAGDALLAALGHPDDPRAPHPVETVEAGPPDDGPAGDALLAPTGPRGASETGEAIPLEAVEAPAPNEPAPQEPPLPPVADVVIEPELVPPADIAPADIAPADIAPADIAPADAEVKDAAVGEPLLTSVGPGDGAENDDGRPESE